LGDFDDLAWSREGAGRNLVAISNCNLRFCSDSDAFMQAKCEGKESVVRLLLEHGAEAKRTDE
jgi:hypothetical protein